MKKLWGDIAYILLAVALVFGTLTLTFPRMEGDSMLEPLTAVLPQPEVSESTITRVEAIASGFPNIPPEVVILVLNWWDPDCPYCIKQLGKLNELVELRPDILVIGLTTSTDEERITEALSDLELIFPTLYGFPDEVLSTIPHTHVLVKQEGGVWRLYEGGSWIGVVDVEELLDYIATKERSDYNV